MISMSYTRLFQIQSIGSFNHLSLVAINNLPKTNVIIWNLKGSKYCDQSCVFRTCCDPYDGNPMFLDISVFYANITNWRRQSWRVLTSGRWAESALKRRRCSLLGKNWEKRKPKSMLWLRRLGFSLLEKIKSK